MKQESIIEVHNLGKSFRTRGNKNALTGLWKPNWILHHAVQDASFTIYRGESVAFLGPNGAGKTTTTKMLSGIMHNSTGSIQVLGYTPKERKNAFLKRIGLVMGNKSGLNWDLTARQSYMLLKEIYDLSDTEFTTQFTLLTKMLSIEDVLDKQVRLLSLGERIKVELAAAMIHDPEVLFLDEPTIGLDIDSKFAVREFLMNLQKKKHVTIILTSHDMDDIEHVCERVLVINKGQMIFDDSISTLNKKYSNWRYIRLTFEHEVAKSKLEKLGELVEVRNYSYLLKVDKKDLVTTVASLGTADGLADISIESVPLERVVSDLFKD